MEWDFQRVATILHESSIQRRISMACFEANSRSRQLNGCRLRPVDGCKSPVMLHVQQSECSLKKQ